MGKAQRQANREERVAAQQAAANAQRRQRWILGSVIGGTIMVVAIIFVFLAGQTTPSSTGKIETFNNIPQSQTTLGNPSAPVTVNEFVDFQCPYCRQYSERVLPSLLPLVRQGKIKIVMHPLTFLGDDSRKIALGATVAQQQHKLFQFAAAAYARQQTENTGYATDQWLRDTAKATSGLNVTTWQQSLNDGSGAQQTSQQVDAATKLAKRWNIDSTPGLVLTSRGNPAVVINPQQTTDPQAVQQAVQQYTEKIKQ